MKFNKKTAALLGIGLLLVIYISGVFYFDNKFLSNTYINDIEVSELSAKEASILVNNDSSWNGISIKYGDELLSDISGEDIDYKYIENKSIYNLADEIRSTGWIKSLLFKSKYDVPLDFSYNEDKLISKVSEISQLEQEVSNAKIDYLDETMEFIIVPGVYKVSLSSEELSSIISDELFVYSNSLDLTDYVERPDIEKENKELIETKNRANILLDIELTYNFGDNEEIINHYILKDWIYSDGVNLSIDNEGVNEFVINNISKYDTYGTNRKFTTSLGNEITTNGGSYGWMTHRSNTTDSLIESIKAGESKEVFPVYSYEAQSRGANDIGDSYVEIDLQNQKVYVYNNGELTLSSDVVTGDISRGFPTPTSVDPITYKTTNAILRGPGYETPVKYWMPFNGDVGLHDASWQSNFGGDAYKTRGSRGCINLPPSVAKKVYDNVYQGMPVIVY